MKKLLLCISVIGVCGVSEGMLKPYHSPLSHSCAEHSARYFPLSVDPLGRHDHTLWKTIADLRKSLSSKSGTEYYNALVSSAKAIMSPDMSFAALIEVGNLAAINGFNVAFQEASRSLLKIINGIDPNVALTGLKNQMQSYCFVDKDEYIPNHMECWNNRGSLALLVNLVSNVKGGNKALRKQAAVLCRILLHKLEEFKVKL